MYYQGKKGDYQCNERSFDEGGEGTLFDILGRPDLCAKIYKPGKLLQTTIDKLSVMTDAVPPGVEDCIAWPLDILSLDGRVCGFVMKKFSGLTPLVHLLSEKSFLWEERIIVAYNLCDMVEFIHKTGQCIGDMNPKNFGVDPKTGHIVSFDADSFHFRKGDKIYPCYVGDEHYYAPEIQRLLKGSTDMRSLDPRTTFTQQTDLFALAELIFQLLFMGHNPFVERTMKEFGYGSSKYVHNPVENIIYQVSPYFNPRPGTDIPVMSVPVTIVPEKMRSMFRNSLLGKPRSMPAEWKEELLLLLRQLKSCTRSNHKYWNGLTECPWCRMEQQKPELDRIMKGPAAPKMENSVPTEPIRPSAPQVSRFSSNSTHSTRSSSSPPPAYHPITASPVQTASSNQHQVSTQTAASSAKKGKRRWFWTEKLCFAAILVYFIFLFIAFDMDGDVHKYGFERGLQHMFKYPQYYGFSYLWASPLLVISNLGFLLDRKRRIKCAAEGKSGEGNILFHIFSFALGMILFIALSPAIGLETENFENYGIKLNTYVYVNTFIYLLLISAFFSPSLHIFKSVVGDGSNSGKRPWFWTEKMTLFILVSWYIMAEDDIIFADNIEHIYVLIIAPALLWITIIGFFADKKKRKIYAAEGTTSIDNLLFHIAEMLWGLWASSGILTGIDSYRDLSYALLGLGTFISSFCIPNLF